jgi:predicted transposase YbfD/YdcC
MEIRSFGEKKPHWEDDTQDVLQEETFSEYFKILEDPRQASKTAHDLLEIIFIAVCAYICGANSWTGIYEFSKAKEDWLKKVLNLSNGLPSRITYWRVFSAIDAEAFQKSFFNWVKGSFGEYKGAIAIDGKELRGFHDNEGYPLNIVSAWATEKGLLLGQVQTDVKSNEITAIPQLLDMLNIKDCVISIDAMGCQKEIAKKIINKNGDYILALKGNQGTLREDVELFFSEEKNNWKTLPYEQVRSIEKGHGRIETREVYVIRDIDWLEQKKEWSNLSAIIMVKSQREIKDKKNIEKRFYITSSKAQIENIAKLIRGHWGIENGLHWTLDVGFREDRQVARNRNLARNLAMLRRISFNHLKQEKNSGLSMENKRFKAAMNTKYLERVLKL